MTEKEIVKEVQKIDKLLDSIPPRVRLKQLEKWLRKNFITAYPVVVVVQNLIDKNLGETYRTNGVLKIRINKDSPKHEQMGSLIHEWAHAVAWPNKRLEKSDWPEHSDEWGLSYVKIYREWFDYAGFLKATDFKIEEEIIKKVSSPSYIGVSSLRRRGYFR